MHTKELKYLGFDPMHCKKLEGPRTQLKSVGLKEIVANNPRLKQKIPKSISTIDNNTLL